jgi:hypothetical protein
MKSNRKNKALTDSYERLQGVRASTVEKHGPTIDASSGKKLLGRNRDLQTSQQDDAAKRLKMEEHSDDDVL